MNAMVISKSKLNDISYCSIKGGNDMHGTIMSELGQLVNLKYLILCELVPDKKLNMFSIQYHV